MRCVLDASVTVALAATDEDSDYAQHLLDELQEGDQFLVPPIWAFEVSNAFVGRYRSGDVDAAGIASTNAALLRLPIVVTSFTVAEALEEVASLARQYTLTTYDASYLYLALRERVPLASLDRQLRRAAERAGCELFQ